MPSAENRTARIRELNDELRMNTLGTTQPHTRLLVTAGISTLPTDDQVAIISAVRDFNGFDQDNDPHHEHDFGALEVTGQKVFFKIDYYDRDCEHGSPDPADPEVTCRVLTIMLAEEY